MPTININISQIQLDVLHTHLIDTQDWVEHQVYEKIRKCTNRVFEASTGKSPKGVLLADKLTELEEYDLQPRTISDHKPKLKHEKKEKNK